MPETGSDDGALLISWIRGPGSEVEPDEPICIVRVGDLTAEIVSPAAGVLGGIYAEPGQQVPPGASLAEIHPALESADRRVDPNSSGQPDTRQEMDEEAPEAEAVLDPLASLASEIEALDLDVPEIRLPREPAPPTEPEALAAELELPTLEPEPPEPEAKPHASEADPELPEPEPNTAEPEPEPPEPDPNAAEEAEPELPEPEPVAAEAELALLESEPVAAELELPDLEPELPEPEPEPVATELETPTPEPEPPEPELPEPEPVAAEQAEPEPAFAAAPPEPEPLPAPAPIELAAFRSPAVRRLAEQHELDLERIHGSGRDGRVTRSDVLAAIAGD